MILENSVIRGFYLLNILIAVIGIGAFHTANSLIVSALAVLVDLLFFGKVKQCLTFFIN